MLKYLVVLALLMSTAFAAKLNIDQRRQKILSIVDEELSEVSRLAKQQNYRSPDTLLRVSELNLEKARLYREVENEQYLAIHPDQRRKLNKASYFKQSNTYFNAANNAALNVVKKFPNYKSIGDVYYILAYNYKELGNNKEAQRFFKLATGKATDPKVLAKSKLALADYYYNDKKYKEAIPLYEATINQADEKWWTKDAFNLAWSYYRVRNYDKAISLMREVHKRSGGKYVDMRSQVERDIGIFYVDANKLNEAISFYDGLGINYTDQFVKIAESIISQGRFQDAEALLNRLERIEKNQEKRNDVLLAKLNIYDKFNKFEDHLKTSQELMGIHRKSPLNKDQFNKFSFQVNKKAAELQKAAASPVYRTVPKVRTQKANQAMAYFAIAGELSPAEKSDKIFYQAETAYAANQFGKALGLYVTAFDGARASNNSKLAGQSLEGMLSSLGQKSLGAKTAAKYYEPVYSRYLSVDTTSPRAGTIYKKLFNTQYDAKNIQAAEKTMETYAKNFPQDFKTQEGMLAKIMDHYREKKDYGSVKNYVARINGGEFKVSKKYADALRSLMTKIQIEGVQQSLEKGDKSVALRGYHDIYESSESTPSAKVNASYNLAALYYELGDSEKSYVWSTTAVKDMPVRDVAKFSDSFLSMAAGLFMHQRFAQSADLFHRMLIKLCQEKTPNKTTAFKNAIFISLANQDSNKALDILATGKRCGIESKVMTDVSFEILKDLEKEKKWQSYENLLTDLEKNSAIQGQLIYPYESLRKQFISIGNGSEAKSIFDKQNRFYNQAKAKKQDVPVEALDLIAERMLVNVVDKKQRLSQVQLAFPEQNFNNAVKQKLQILDQMTNDVNNIQKVGSGKGIVEAYSYAISAYEAFGTELMNFSPEGKSPEYVESFRKAMATVHGPILQNARKQRNEIKSLIAKNKILSDSNFDVLFSNLESFKRYIVEKEAVLMERGGVK